MAEARNPLISFRNYASILNENEQRIAATTAKYEGKLLADTQVFNRVIDAAFVKNIAERDPTPNKIYLDWMMRQSVEDPRFLEDLHRTTEDLRTYNRVKGRLPVEQRDINRIKDKDTLYAAVAPFAEVKSGKEEKKEFSDKMKAQMREVYRGHEGTVLVPLTKEAAIFLGRGTRWCTAATNSNQFKHYNDQGPLYVLIHADGVKWQAHAGSGQIADDTDKTLSYDVVKKSALFAKIRPLFEQEIVTSSSASVLLRYATGMALKSDVIETRLLGMIASGSKEPYIEILRYFVAAHGPLPYTPLTHAIAKGKNPTVAWSYISRFPQWEANHHRDLPGIRIAELEPMLAGDPEYALDYAMYILKDRFPAGEKAIAKLSTTAFHYASHVIKGRWPMGESAISKNPVTQRAYEMMLADKGTS